jgi:hypothetical protein
MRPAKALESLKNLTDSFLKANNTTIKWQTNNHIKEHKKIRIDTPSFPQWGSLREVICKALRAARFGA